MSRRIVVTGLGTCSPLGMDVASTWSALLAGRSGISNLPQRCTQGMDLPVTFAGSLPSEIEDYLPRNEMNRLDRASQASLIAAREAVKDAGQLQTDPERIGVSWGTGIGGIGTVLDAWNTLVTKGPRRVMPMTVPMLMANAPAVAVGMEVQARAATRTAVSACASSTESLVMAFEMIQSGTADVVFAGGSEAALNPLTVSAFAALHALSKRNDDPEGASRPFNRDRDGFVMAEGAAVLVLEEREHALARGARIYAEFASAALNSDAYHLTAPEPVGRLAAKAMNDAISMAGLKPADINHVNAHATSTPVGDTSEYHALKTVFGDALPKVQVSATKSSTGHLLGAAGALEAVLTVKAVQESIMPPTRNYTDPDPEITLNVSNQSRRLDEPIIGMSNSFGFGGHNAVVIFIPAS